MPFLPRRCAIETLESRQMLDAGLVISEFMAVNNATLADENGQFSDWIEVHNPTAEAVNLDGWYLTDDADDLTKWQFPAQSLAPNEYLVAFASDKDRAVAQGELHTNFRLSSGGEYLALVEPDGTTVAHAYAPEYPDQTADVSYGLADVAPTVLLDERAVVSFLVPTADDAPLAATWTASDFDDTAWSEFGRVSPVLITEAATGGPDFVEIQNVSSETVSTSGWVVAVNDASSFNINAVATTTWQLDASMPAGEVRYRTNVTDDNYWGGPFQWRTQGPGWVMILDDAGTVQDFVVWGYSPANLETLSVEVNGFTITSADIWKGDAVPPLGGRTNSLQRHGTADHDHASDWAFVDDQSKGTPNANLAISIPGTPKTGVGFNLGSPGFGDALQTDVADQMYGVNASLWTRIEFDVDDPNSLDTLLLGIKYDDGFVAYLNGMEIARRNAPGAEGTVPAYNASATATHPDEDVLKFEPINVTAHIAALRPGTNILAIHGLNVSASDDDFLLLPWLEATMVDPDVPVGVLVEPTPGEHNSAVISAAAMISTAGRTFTGSLEVEISAATPRTTIHYTVDGSRPTAASPVYTGPITLNTSADVRALAIQKGYDPSHVVGEGYVRLASDVAAFNSNLPILIVESFGDATANRNTMGDFHLTVFEPDAVTGRTTLTAEAELSTRLGLKIRGSSSAGFPKKQYRVETRNQDDRDDNVRLLGMPSESDWVFGAPYTDKALIRNSLAFDLGREVGLEAPGTRHVELFYNENGGDLRAADYMGVYFVAEAIKIGDNRLDVSQLEPEDIAEPDITGGYLIRFDGGRAIAADTLVGWNSLEFVNAEDYNTQQRQWMSSFVTEFHNNLHGPDYADPDTGYAQYIDVDSFVNLMVINELTRDQDAYVRSNFLYKNREGLLTQGPLWDYNLIMGTGCCFDNRNTQGWQYQHPYNRGLQQNRGDDPDWIVRLMSDPDFAIQFRDRWFELRQGLLSLDALYDRVHAHADPLAEAAVRNFQKWNTLLGDSRPGFPSPVTSTWQQQIEFILDRDAPGQYSGWLADRIAWIDGQLLSLAPPVFSQAGGEVAPGFELTVSAPAGTIYYTLDGADPRAPGGAVNFDSAVEYNGAVELTDPVVVKARVLNAATWSAVNEAFFLVGVAASVENVVISEINYNPYPPTDAELQVDPNWTAEDFEFVELRNVGPHTVKLDEAAFVDGIDHTFQSGSVTTLNPGELLVLARNPAAYAVRYPDAPTPAGSYLGKLSNNGEEIELRDFLGGRILRFEYNDGAAWPGRADGKGASLELIEPDSVPAAEPARSAYLDDPDHWRSSVGYGGTPGSVAEPDLGIVINEVLSHTDWPQVDTIELFNAGSTPVELGGWFLSDSWGWDPLVVDAGNDSYKKFRIPDDTTLAPGQYLTFNENDFNPMPVDPLPAHFALNGAHGDDVWLMRADAQGNLTHFGDHVDLGAQANGESWGRSAGGGLYPMIQFTPDATNSNPRLGSVIVSEVFYNPGDMPSADDLEFVEIYNSRTTAVDLTDWRLDKAVDYEFPSGTMLDGLDTAVIVAFDPATEPLKLAAFTSHHNIQDPINLFGPYRGQLRDDGERVQLQYPDEPPTDEPGFIPHLLEDEVIYDDDPDWPLAADGTGDSLHRITPATWGNDPASWTAASPTPGSVQFDPYVAGRYVFYNESSFNGDAAIATDKRALLPGEVGRRANYTSYVHGINGIIVDLANLPDGATLGAGDFQFHFGNDDTPGDWPMVAPENVTVEPGAGGSARATITFESGQLRNGWLQVTVGPTTDVFYFGNAVAEAGNSLERAEVTTADLLLARNNPRDQITPAAIDCAYDYDRDGQVNATDVLLARNNQTSFLNALKLIDLSGEVEEAQAPPLANLAWLTGLDQPATQRSTQTDAAAGAVDLLLATLWS